METGAGEANEQQPISYLNVRFSNKAISEMVDDQPVVEIEKAAIKRVSLAYGFTAERMLLQLVMGVVFTIVGLLPLRLVFNWFQEGGTLYDSHLLIVGLLPIGVWVIKGAVRRSHFLLVESVKEKRKVVFKGRPVEAKIRALLTQASQVLGYRIEGF